MNALLNTLYALYMMIRGIEAEIKALEAENPHDPSNDIVSFFLFDNGSSALADKLSRLKNAYREAFVELEKVQERHMRCPRCSGQGTIFAYAHVMDGVCFRCKGSGIDPEATKIDPGVPAPSDL